MQRRVVSPTYSYVGDGVIAVAMTFQLVDPAGKVLFDRVVSRQINVRAEGWAQTLKTEIVAECHALTATYQQVMDVAAAAMPGVTTPDDALAALAAMIETEINA